MLKCLSPNLNRPGVPRGEDAARFSADLKRLCGAVVLWNSQRRAFVVARFRGEHMPMTSYFDVRPPFTSSLLRSSAQAVRYYDAQASGDPMQMLQEIRRMSQDAWDRKRRAFVSECVPEMCKVILRAHEIQTDGRYRPRVFDMAGSRLRASA